MAVYLALPNVLFRPTLEALAGAGLPAAHDAGRREAVRHGPRRREGAQRADRAVVRRARRLPHRPLRGQADRAGRPGAAVRQPDLRAGVEQRPHQPRRHHLVRVAGPGGPGQLLRPRGRTARHDPEPPAADARARRDGPAAVDHRARPARPEGRGAAGGGTAEARGHGEGRPGGPATRRARSAARSCRPTRTPRASTRPATPRPTPRSPSASSNWRWAGTPFRLRTGKAIGQERREIAVYFRSVPHEPFDDRDRPERPALHPLPRRHRPGAEPQRRGRPVRPRAGDARQRLPRPGAAALQPAAQRRSSRATRRCPSGATRPRSCGGSSSRCCRRGSATRCRWRSIPPGRAARRARRPRPGVARGEGRRQGTARARADGRGTTLARRRPPRRTRPALSSPPRSSAAARAGPGPGPQA